MFFQTLSIELPPPILYTDNIAAESIMTHEPEYQRSKHIESDITSPEIALKKEHSIFDTFLANKLPTFIKKP